MLVASSRNLNCNRLARSALVAIGALFVLNSISNGQALSESSWLRMPYTEMLDDSEHLEKVELTSVLAPADPQSSASAPGELPPPADAKQDADPMKDVLRRLDALEKSAKPAAAKQEDAGAKGAEKSVLGEWVDMSSEKWNVKLGGHMQLDSINWADHDPQVPAFNYIEFRRLRLLADGVGYGVYDFRLQIDIEPESGEGTDRPVVDIKDAYLTMHELPSPLNRWRIGNFFVPFSLEQVTNDTNNIFLERSIPTQGIFAADREVGMAFYGVNDAKDLTWTFGTFVDSLSESTQRTDR